MKKAQGISINVIIIAAVALIVLIVLVAIFTGRLGVFSSGVASCADKGGSCQMPPCTGDTTILRGTDCDRDGMVCCLPV